MFESQWDIDDFSMDKMPYVISRIDRSNILSISTSTTRFWMKDIYYRFVTDCLWKYIELLKSINYWYVLVAF